MSAHGSGQQSRTDLGSFPHKSKQKSAKAKGNANLIKSQAQQSKR